MLRAMAKIEFADGVREVDDEYVPLLNEATHGEPKRHTFQRAMAELGRVTEKRALRNAEADLIKGHFQRWGL